MTLETQKKMGILEGDLAMRKLLTELLTQEGFSVTQFENAGEVSQAGGPFDVLLTSVPSLMENNLESFSEIRKKHPDLGILVIPTSNELEKARQLVQQGAFSLVTRPFAPWELIHRVRKACELMELKKQNQWLRRKEGRDVNSELAISVEDSPTLDELEKRYIEIVLKKTGGRKDKASRLLGINRRTLYRKEREYGWVSKESPTLPLVRAAN